LLKSVFSEESLTFSAAVLKPSAPSFAVWTNPFSTSATSLILFFASGSWTDLAEKHFVLRNTQSTPAPIAHF
jgi:hypothetical protein